MLLYLTLRVCVAIEEHSEIIVVTLNVHVVSTLLRRCYLATLIDVSQEIHISIINVNKLLYE